MLENPEYEWPPKELMSGEEKKMRNALYQNVLKDLLPEEREGHCRQFHQTQFRVEECEEYQYGKAQSDIYLHASLSAAIVSQDVPRISHSGYKSFMFSIKHTHACINQLEEDDRKLIARKIISTKINAYNYFEESRSTLHQKYIENGMIKLRQEYEQIIQGKLPIVQPPMETGESKKPRSNECSEAYNELRVSYGNILSDEEQEVLRPFLGMHTELSDIEEYDGFPMPIIKFYKDINIPSKNGRFFQYESVDMKAFDEYEDLCNFLRIFDELPKLYRYVIVKEYFDRLVDDAKKRMSDKLTTNKETEIPAYNPDFLLADLQQYKRKLQKTFRVILDGKLVELFNKSNNGGPDQI